MEKGLVAACFLGFVYGASSLPGLATYYNPHVPLACYGDVDNGVMIAAASDSIWGNRSACGRLYSVRCTGATNAGVPQPCTGKSVTVRIVDYCPPGCRGTLDLSQEAFSIIANRDSGMVRIEYQQSTGMQTQRSSSKKRPLALVVTITVVTGILFMGTLIFCLWRMAFKIKGIKVKNSSRHSTHLGTSVRRAKDSLHTNGFNEDGKEELNVPYFDFETIASATENFADYNKLGQGGFGPVYKGKLLDGQEIAVKRLSRSSRQGQEEFKNEVVLIAKLQHRNLVRLLGYCIEGDEKMLLYEFLSNKSLDLFIFDPNQCKLLDWERRFNIIIGIARGLLYIHHDSRLRIIHRDLKTSNVLLDEEMNPKISDFGMARMFGGNQIEASTNRVVGTYGYMSPEYASHGLFSIKSDVFSFGVILLEIVCGKKNSVFYQSQDSLTLLGHAWQLWNEGKELDLIDPSISLKCNTSIALNCIHVGLLCVQEDATARPTMASIITMLGSEAAINVTPKKPAFFMSLENFHLSLEERNSSSRNEETMSTMDGR